VFVEWRNPGREVAVIGLGRSGVAVSRLLRRGGVAVYASDKASSADPASIRELEAIGVAVEVGSHDLIRIAGAAAVIVSPGVPPTAAAMLAAKKAGTPVFAEVDVAARSLAEGTRVLGVTGTNGKTTTTALIAHLLAAAGRPSVAAGNIGLALSEVAMDAAAPPWVVVELSSFQLHDAPHMNTKVGVFLNLTPDHLDRYGSLEAYYADKANLFRNATTESIWVTNADDKEVQRIAAGVPGTHLRFSLTEQADAWYDATTQRLMVGDTAVASRGDLRLLGSHNVANALASILAVHAAGIPLAGLGQGLATFDALPHRLEPVGTVDGVVWINDSKATNVVSTSMATAALDTPFVLLLGGIHKGAPYTTLAPTLRRCRAIVAYGEAAPIIARDLTGTVPVYQERLFEDVLARAHQLAQEGDAVLLSPACSSFDMFTNYEERGTTFREAVGRL
jgi:UDP-N-acetylmuramoylalanine--D-glutamate ligase